MPAQVFRQVVFPPLREAQETYSYLTPGSLIGGKPPFVVVAPVAGVFAAFGFFFSLLLRIWPLDMMISFVVSDCNLLRGL